MADVDHRDAPALQRLDHRKQSLSIGGGERRGRLIHDDDLGVEHQSAGNFHELLFGNAQLAHPRVRVQIRLAEQCQCLFYNFLLAFAETETAFFNTQRNVFLHGQVRCQSQFLVNHGNARQPAHGGRSGCVRLAIKHDCARIGLFGTAQYFHQRAFPGSVLSNQGVDFAVPHFQVHAPECLDRPE